MISRFFIAVALFLFTTGGSLVADTDIGNAQAIFIYNFLTRIKWPDGEVGNSYTIGVYGKTPTTKYLKNYTKNRRIGSKPIEVVDYTSVNEVKGCEVLLVAHGKSSEMTTLSQRLNGKACLIVGEKSGTVRMGAAVDFKIINGKLRYKLDKANAEKHNLLVSNSLIQMSI